MTFRIALAAALALATAIPALGQTWTSGSNTQAIQAPLRSAYVPSAGRYLIEAEDVGGWRVTGASVSGTTLTIDYLDANDAPQSLDFTAVAGSADGVVTGMTFDGETLTLARSIGVDLTRDIDEILRTGASGQLPAAVDNQLRLALSGNTILDSRYVVTIPGHSRSVTLETLPSNGAGVVVGGTTYGAGYRGNFAAPPNVNNYSANDFIWDRGSQIWLFNGLDPNNPGARNWVGYSGPTGFQHGFYGDDDAAGSHARAVGQIFVIGTGSGQAVKYVATYVQAATDELGWVWIPVGLQGSDVPELSDDAPDTLQPDQSAASGIGAMASRADHSHGILSSAPVAIGSSNAEGNSDTFARSNHVHEGLLLSSGAPDALQAGQSGASGNNTRASRADHEHQVPVAAPVATGNANAAGSATTFSRSDHVHLSTGGLAIAAYSSTATYSRGSANSFVTSGGELYIYTSGSERSSNHNPGTFPNYWLRVSHAAEFVNVGSGSHRYKAGTFLLIDNDIYLATTNITTPRDSAYVIANAGDNQEFLLVNIGGGGGASLSDDTPVSLTPDIAGAAGTGTEGSRSDHAHSILTAMPVNTGAANAEGSSDSFSRADHVHDAFASITPEEILVGGNSSQGLATSAARADHDHQALPAAPVAVGATNQIGTVSSFNRSNHVHQGVSSIAVAGTGLSVDQSTGAVTITGSGSGGGGATSVVAFDCVMDDVAAAEYTTVTQILECDTIRINDGGFTVENASQTDTTDRVVIPTGAGGVYEMVASAFASRCGRGRQPGGYTCLIQC